MFKFSIIRNFQRQPYMLRITLFNFFNLFSLKLHYFLQSDDRGSENGELLNHSHPWSWFRTLILSKYGYKEVTDKGTFWRKRFYWGGGDGDYFHRVELMKYPDNHPDYPGLERGCLTLFFTGPKHNKLWGYRCSKEIIPFNKFDYKKGCP